MQVRFLVYYVLDYSMAYSVLLSVLREEMKYDKNEHTKSRHQRPIGACDAGLTDTEYGDSRPRLLG